VLCLGIGGGISHGFCSQTASGNANTQLAMTKSLIVLLLFPLFCLGQKQGNIWYFAEYSGLDFTTGTPVPISNGQIHSISPSYSEGCSSICDSSGNLLFYATPTSIWNRNHNLMPNGTGLLGGLSSTQGVLIIPKPTSSDLFYVFTLDEFQNNLNNGLRYSIVDMCLDNTMGDVISTSKNILLLDETGEKMAATYHSNGTDIWLVTRKHFTNEFYSYLITENGISNPVVTSIGWSNPNAATYNAFGQMKISPDGSKISFAVGNQNPFILQLFDFNNETGTISNLIDLPTGGNYPPYGVSFSPDNSKLYVVGLAPTGLAQFDLSSGNSDTIINSIFHVPLTTGPTLSLGIQLANNGKIYLCQSGEIGVINHPNLSGSSCDFISNAISSNSSYTFPGFIDNFNYKNGIPSCVVGIDKNEQNSISLSPNPFFSSSILQGDKVFTNATLTLYNTLGQQVRQVNNINGRTLNLLRDNLSSGIYFLQLKQENQTIGTDKLIIADF
jgi:large repetitive protein